MKITVCPCVNGGITHASVQPTVNKSHSQTSPIFSSLVYTDSTVVTHRVEEW